MKLFKYSVLVFISVYILFFVWLSVKYPEKLFGLRNFSWFAAISGPGSGLISYYNFEEGSGITAGDSEGSNNGTLVGDPVWVEGKVGSGALQIISNSNVSISAIPLVDTYSISIWIYPLGGGGLYQSLITTTYGDGLVFYNNNRVCLLSSSCLALSTEGGISLNNWHHVVAIIDSGVTTFYIDGAVAGSGGAVNFSPIIIGNDTYNEYLIGSLDDLRLYNRVLTGEEVTELYNLGQEVSPGDTTPPDISDIASSTTETTATITWNTNEAATSTVYYGPDTNYGSASSSDSLSTMHSITLTNLTASTPYHFQVSSADSSGNLATSSDNVFTTTATSTPPDDNGSSSFHYIRPGAAGTGDGTDWTNAYPSFASTTWVRGDTYYIAGGTFNENVILAQAESGSTWIYLKKATASSHGTDTGWNSDYGTNVAEIKGTLEIDNSYFNIDGVTGSDDSGYGIKISHQVVGGAVVRISDISHIHLKHLELIGTGSSNGAIGSCAVEDGVYSNNTTPIDDHILSYLWIHGVNRNGLTYGGINGSPGLLFEHNRVEDTGLHPDPDCHGQGFQIGYSNSQSGLTIRFNKFIDLNGSAMIAFLGYSTNSDIKIYDNLFWSNDVNIYSSSPGVIWVSDVSTIVDGLYVYNNTFYNIKLAQIANDAVTNSNAYVRNNIWENSQFTGVGGIHRGVTADHNYYYNNTGTPPIGGTDQSGTSTVFVDAAGHDFHLLNNSLTIDVGADLGSPYNSDFDNNSRPQGSGWDLGAFEYISGDSEETPVDDNTDGAGAHSGGGSGSRLVSVTNTATTSVTAAGTSSAQQAICEFVNFLIYIGVVDSNKAQIARAVFGCSTANVSSLPITISNKKPLLTTNLYPGLHSAEVISLKIFLNARGYFNDNKDFSDYYGSLTTQAVQKFQKAHGIVLSGTPDTTGFGVVGPRTREAINSM